MHTDGHFAGQGGVRLYWQAWRPDGEVRAALIVAHGFGEHGGRYMNLVDYFVPRGFAVYAVDHRGYGRSEGPRGHFNRLSEIVSDLHAFRVRVEAEEKGKPLVLVGHSMGGLIAVLYLLEHSSGLAAAVLSSPLLGMIEKPSRARLWITRILSVIAPRASFTIEIKGDLLSRDASVGRAYVADPLVHGRISMRVFTEFVKGIADARQRAPEIQLPFLALQAGADGLVDPAATEQFTRTVGSKVKEFRSYPGLYHEIFNEIDKEKVFADLERWIEVRLAGSESRL